VRPAKGGSSAKGAKYTSAKGAKYNSQGQALSGAKRVAPGEECNDREALKERNNQQ